MAGTEQGGRKTSEGGRGDTHKTSPAAIERYLKGIDFPAKKEELIHHAENKEAPSDVLHVLNNLKEAEYHTAIDVAKEVGQLENE